MNNIITIDGTVSSGKSSVGFEFSKRINYQFIDSGIYYRLITFILLAKGESLGDESNNANIIKNIDLEFITSEQRVDVVYNNEIVTDKLQEEQVSKNVSVVATQRQVRDAICVLERKAAENKDIVMCGRDIGTEIFPDAKLKFYIDAPVEIRAKRRFSQYVQNNPQIKYEDILKDVMERDKKDMERDYHPLKKADDAIEIVNANQSLNDTVDELYLYYKKVFNT